MASAYLLDTHCLIWALLEPQQLSSTHRELLNTAPQRFFVSAVSIWEISLKFQLGKLELTGVTPEELLEAAEQAGFQRLELTMEELASSYRLPPVKDHKDPFDRLLIWQSLRRKLTFMSNDQQIKAYKSHGLKLA